MAIISFVLAETSVHDQTTDDLDHIDHVDHVDHFDHVDHIDHIDHVDYFDHVDHIDHVDHVDHPDYVDHIDHVDHLDHADHVDHPDYIDHIDHVDHPDNIDHSKEFQVDSSIQESSTPAPFMLLLSSGLLIFGISGIASYYIIGDIFKFLMFMIAPAASIITTKLISIIWRKIAISKHYAIASTQNLLGKMGEVVLKVDDDGGVIKIPSNNPMKYEKVNVMPFQQGEVYEREEKVYIVGVRNETLLVDRNSKVLRKKY
jgi:hypothetical protein